MTNPSTARIAGSANAASLMVRIAFRPKNVYLEKNTANGRASRTDSRALRKDSQTVNPRILHV